MNVNIRFWRKHPGLLIGFQHFMAIDACDKCRAYIYDSAKDHSFDFDKLCDVCKQFNSVKKILKVVERHNKKIGVGKEQGDLK